MYKPLPLESLALNQPVPVNIWDPKGVLLLRKGEPITSEQHRGHLMLHTPMVLAADWQAWGYSYTAALDRMVRGNESLSRIAALDAMVPVHSKPEASDELAATEAWADTHAALNTLLHQGADASHFIERLERLTALTDKLWREHPDDSLLILVQLLFDPGMHYSATHALLTAGLCTLVGPSAGTAAGDQLALVRAALTMNIGMTALQDELAEQRERPTPVQQEAIKSHPEESMMLLERLFINDALWLDVVGQHHATVADRVPLANQDPVDRLTRVLGTIDRYAAMISPRKSRAGRSATDSVRAIVGQEIDQRDEVSYTLVRSIGLCPPGTFVKLDNGETAIVLRRSEKANHPLVASLLDRTGTHHAQPSLYQTATGKPRIQSALARSAVSLELNHRTMVRLGLYAAQHSAGLRGLISGPGSL